MVQTTGGAYIILLIMKQQIILQNFSTELFLLSPINISMWNCHIDRHFDTLTIPIPLTKNQGFFVSYLFWQYTIIYIHLIAKQAQRKLFYKIKIQQEKT